MDYLHASPTVPPDNLSTKDLLTAGYELSEDPLHYTVPEQHGLGIPCKKRCVSWKDISVTSAGLVCFGLAVAVVWNSSLASWLGRTYQLVAMGLLMSLMALCTQRQVVLCALVYEIHNGKSTLQTLDGLLRNDKFQSGMSFWPRMILFSLFALPLILGASYKTFVGGLNRVAIPSSGGYFGLTAAPGYQRIGVGVSLTIELYNPFWTKPAINSSYGFNLWVDSNTTAAVLDAPIPSFVAQLQAGLLPDESLVLTATVNATVAEAVFDLYDYTWYNKSSPQLDSMAEVFGANAGFYGGGKDGSQFGWDWTQLYLSWWNEGRNQTFESEARKVNLTRRLCSASWAITPTTVILDTAAILQTGEEAVQSSSQVLLSHNQLDLQMSASPVVLIEFDPTSRQNPFPGATELDPQWKPDILLYPALAASITWARIVSLDGPETTFYQAPKYDEKYHVMYWKDPGEITVEKQIPTMKRSPLLLMVLLVNPVVILVAVIWRSSLYSTPITEGFGIISLIAGLQESSLYVLRGAALSGKLRQPVRVRLGVTNSGQGTPGRVQVDLNAQKQSGSLRCGQVYG